MKRVMLALIVLLPAACAVPPERTLRTNGDPLAGLRPPPPPAPALYEGSGPAGPPDDRPPVVIVPAPDRPADASFPDLPWLIEENVYGSDAPYGDGFGARRFRRRR